MSSTKPSDPRLLLPEWLRDSDVPASVHISDTVTSENTVQTIDPIVEQPGSVPIKDQEPVTISVAPFSDRLSIDTRLDPGQLVSASDLPKWLGGLERVSSSIQAQPISVLTKIIPPTAGPIAIEKPEPYEGVDPQESGVIDVRIPGWIVAACAIGLLILLVAALRLYLS